MDMKRVEENGLRLQKDEYVEFDVDEYAVAVSEAEIIGEDTHKTVRIK